MFITLTISLSCPFLKSVRARAGESLYGVCLEGTSFTSRYSCKLNSTAIVRLGGYILADIVTLIKCLICLHDTNLNTLSTQTPRGQELLGHIKKEWQIKMMACFSSSLMKRVFKNFMRIPKLAHILVKIVLLLFTFQITKYFADNCCERWMLKLSR